MKINVPIILALLVFHEHIIGLVFYRIRNPADFEEYITAFNVLDAFSNLDTFEFFFGAQSNLLYYTDAGFLGLFYFAGLGLFICWFGFVALEGLRSHLVRNKIYFQKNSWLDEESQLVILNKISFFSVGVCVFGLAHYTTSLELGISQVFSFFLGVLMYTSKLLYIYSKSQKNIRYILNNTNSGGVCINSNDLHFFNHELPFGGVNNSGIGSSHGKHGFMAFSNERSIYRQHIPGAIELLMPPYNNFKQTLINLTIKWF